MLVARIRGKEDGQQTSITHPSFLPVILAQKFIVSVMKNESE